jgi:hypothetical protein
LLPTGIAAAPNPRKLFFPRPEFAQDNRGNARSFAPLNGQLQRHRCVDRLRPGIRAQVAPHYFETKTQIFTSLY